MNDYTRDAMQCYETCEWWGNAKFCTSNSRQLVAIKVVHFKFWWEIVWSRTSLTTRTKTITESMIKDHGFTCVWVYRDRGNVFKHSRSGFIIFACFKLRLRLEQIRIHLYTNFMEQSPKVFLWPASYFS